MIMVLYDTVNLSQNLLKELCGKKWWKEQTKDDATQFSWLYPTPVQQAFKLCVMQTEREIESDDSLYSPISL